MNSYFLCATLTCAAAIHLGAQAQAPTADEMTLTGCVQENELVSSPAEIAVGAPGSTKFVLKIKDHDSATTSGSGSPSQTPAYRLDVQQNQLTPHIGHTVEIKGTPATRPPVRTNSADPTPDTEKPLPVLKVKSVRMVSSNCG